MFSYQPIQDRLLIEGHQLTHYFCIFPHDTLTMTKTTETETCPEIAINGKETTTDRIETAYTFLLEWLVKKGKTRSPVGWAGILTTPLECTLLQGAHAVLPAGPSQTPPTPTDAPIYPATATQHQIYAAKCDWMMSKKIWKEYCNAEEGGKAI